MKNLKGTFKNLEKDLDGSFLVARSIQLGSLDEEEWVVDSPLDIYRQSWFAFGRRSRGSSSYPKQTFKKKK